MPFGLPANSRRRPRQMEEGKSDRKENTFCAALRWTELSSFLSGIHLNRNRCASSTFRTAGPALPRKQRGGCRRKAQGQPAGSELPHLMSGGVAPGMRNQWQGTCRSSQAGSVFGPQGQHRSPAPKRPPDNIPHHHRPCPAQYIFQAVPDEHAWRRRLPLPGGYSDVCQ